MEGARKVRVRCTASVGVSKRDQPSLCMHACHGHGQEKCTLAPLPSPWAAPGKVIMDTSSKLAKAPDGNGGVYMALHRRGGRGGGVYLALHSERAGACTWHCTLSGCPILTAPSLAPPPPRPLVWLPGQPGPHAAVPAPPSGPVRSLPSPTLTLPPIPAAWSS